ncbi:hypothetical protein G7Y89_g7629 [Cudoniella acicularis]|uniref:Uncharacterized protein n=1 Tax=Cudoniella acicularis TaxID=354080 RepID=A0A8H4RI33_9HELO|nr:hypothetical protein G7Y89_g7629 [Cudoniella acicularis]
MKNVCVPRFAVTEKQQLLSESISPWREFALVCEEVSAKATKSQCDRWGGNKNKALGDRSGMRNLMIMTGRVVHLPRTMASVLDCKAHLALYSATKRREDSAVEGLTVIQTSQSCIWNLFCRINRYRCFVGQERALEAPERSKGFEGVTMDVGDGMLEVMLDPPPKTVADGIHLGWRLALWRPAALPQNQVWLEPRPGSCCRRVAIATAVYGGKLKDLPRDETSWSSSTFPEHTFTFEILLPDLRLYI